MTHELNCNLHGHIWFYPEFGDTVMLDKRICFVCFKKEKKKPSEWIIS